MGRRGIKEYRAAEALVLIAADRDHRPLVCPTCSTPSIDRNPKRNEEPAGRVTLTCKAAAGSPPTLCARPSARRRSRDAGRLRGMPSPTLLIFFTVFLDLIGFGIVLPLLPSYAAALHVSDAADRPAGGELLADAVHPGPLVGPALRPHRPAAGAAGGARRAARSPICSSRLADSFWMLLLSRMVVGRHGSHGERGPGLSRRHDSAGKRAQAMGLIGAAFGLGFVVGPALGGISSRFGDAAPGLVASALTASELPARLAWLPESRARPRSGGNRSTGALVTLHHGRSV